MSTMWFKTLSSKKIVSALTMILLSSAATAATSTKKASKKDADLTSASEEPLAPTPTKTAPAKVEDQNLSWLTSGSAKGISFTLPTGGDASVGMSWFLDANNALETNLLGSFERAKSVNSWGFGIGLGYRMYSSLNYGNFRPFAEPGLSFTKTPGAKSFASSMVMAATFAIGGEYFVSQNFSISAQTGLQASFADSFDTIKTGTQTSSVSAHFYW